MFIFTAITAVTVYAFNVTPVSADTDYLRIHVRANSNEQIDQSVKYIVKDEVVKFITPYAAQCTDKQKAVELVKSILPEIEKVCDRRLKHTASAILPKPTFARKNSPRVYTAI